MHELSLCQGLLEVLEEQARTQDFARVKAVWLEVGQLAAVESEALRFCFDVVVRGTLAEGARLHLVELPGQAWCLDCARSVPIHSRLDACPGCGSYRMQVTDGEKLQVRELEVE
jgi:hydrogenase nickel incorporation protein HypA/HybF